jgi:hypothetical protein
MSPKDLPGGIGCEEAQNLANLYFNGLGGDVVKRPYLQHIELCEKCQAIHQRWVAWLWELGEVIGDAFGYVPENQESMPEL